MDLAKSAPLLYNYWPFAAAISAVVVAHRLWKYYQQVRHDNNDYDDDDDGGKLRKKSVSFCEKIETLPTSSKYAAPDTPTDDDNFFSVADDAPHVPYKPTTYALDTMMQRSGEFYKCMNQRRSCRFFSDKPVPLDIIKNIIRAAGTSPSGAHTEPWTYVVVSDPEIKQQIREIIEEEEYINYNKRMGQDWVDDLKSIGTTWKKPYLETAPYVVCVFKQVHGYTLDGARKTHYYSEMSVCISVGLLIAAVQYAGLVTLTSTPMNSGPRLRHLLGRPVNEKVHILLPIGYPTEDATVPDFQRKPIDDIMVHV